MGHLDHAVPLPPPPDGRSMATPGLAGDVDRASAGQPAVTVERLGKHFGARRVLDEVSFTIRPGTILGLLGPNGAGKTTVVRILATLLAPYSGRVVVAGHSVDSDPAGVRRCIGLAGQHAAVDGYLTGVETLELVGVLRGLSRSQRRAQATELLERFDLGAHARRQIRTYSGGTRRRLDLAASLVGSPPVLFLDEPTTGLDAHSRQALWEVVRAQADAGVTVLLTTQYLEEADVLADELVVLNRGRVVASGSSSELKSAMGAITLHVRVPASDVARVLAAHPHAALRRGTNGDGREVVVPLTRSAEAVDAIAVLASMHLNITDVRLEEPSLDSVFLALTGERGEEARPL